MMIRVTRALTGRSDAGARDADAFAPQSKMMMLDSIVAACAGGQDAARRAKDCKDDDLRN